MEDYLKTNKKLWDAKTEIHIDSDFYDVPSFLKGKDSLNTIELELLGNIKDKSILHLQCHFGMDTISLCRHGAIATGVDFSPKALEVANRLNKELSTKARFIESDVYSLPEKLDEQFDIIYTSYGVVGWLPDMDAWAKVIKTFLKPGGKLILVEFHPVVWMFSYDFSKIEYKYNDPTPIVEYEEGTYADASAPIKNKAINWNHGLSTVCNALIKQELQINALNEYDYSPYNCFEKTVESNPGKYQIIGMEGNLPMVYSIVAHKLKIATTKTTH